MQETVGLDFSPCIFYHPNSYTAQPTRFLFYSLYSDKCKIWTPDSCSVHF